MVKGVRKASKVEAAAQRTADVEKQRLIATTEDLARFEDMLARNNHAGQRLHATNVSQNNEQAKVRTSHGRKRADTRPIVNSLLTEEKTSRKANFHVIKNTSVREQEGRDGCWAQSCAMDPW